MASPAAATAEWWGGPTDPHAGRRQSATQPGCSPPSLVTGNKPHGWIVGARGPTSNDSTISLNRLGVALAVC